MDVFVILAMNEPPLLHLPYPSVDAARAEIRATNDGTQPLEPYQLISQYTLEPLLKSVAETLPSVRVEYGTEFLSLAQDAAGVTATVKSQSGQTRSIRAAYLVGCDGGASPVRRELGIKLRGEGNLLKLRQALYRCDELFEKIPIGNGPGKGRHYHVADGQATFLIMQDSTRHFTLHSVVEQDSDMKAMFEKTVAIPVDYEMLYCGEWKQNLLLADSYGTGRVFLAGDAVHLVIPTGGLGMNTGVGDAIDLSWKLAATLKGWGGPGLLASYEIERRQIGDRAVAASRYASLGRRKWRSAFRPNIRDSTPEGQATRDNLARIADIEQRKTNEMIGAELGYRYQGSPIIWEEPGGPEHLFREYHPTTWPGARLPHVWLRDGTPIQDHIPVDGYTLLRLGRTKADASGLERAFRSLRAPFAVIDLAEDAARQIYGYDLLLLRPDMHVVWRGNGAHEEPDQLAAVATGHAEVF
jgi:2-polyprenyl-6-methoxyphenol hydroxylase-like FAD-dependent oxidoreductase